MSDYLDVLLAIVIAVGLGYLTFRMYQFDRSMDDLRNNGQFAPIVFPQESRYRERRRELRRMNKYAYLACIIVLLMVFVMLRLNGTVGSLL